MLSEHLQPVLDPSFAVFEAFSAEHGTADTAGNAVVITGHVNIDQLASRRGHSQPPFRSASILPNPIAAVKLLCLSFFSN
jgi:hypothetical protein